MFKLFLLSAILTVSVVQCGYTCQENGGHACNHAEHAHQEQHSTHQETHSTHEMNVNHKTHESHKTRNTQITHETDKTQDNNAQKGRETHKTQEVNKGQEGNEIHKTHQTYKAQANHEKHTSQVNHGQQEQETHNTHEDHNAHEAHNAQETHHTHENHKFQEANEHHENHNHKFHVIQEQDKTHEGPMSDQRDHPEHKTYKTREDNHGTHQSHDHHKMHKEDKTHEIHTHGTRVTHIENEGEGHETHHEHGIRVNEGEHQIHESHSHKSAHHETNAKDIQKNTHKKHKQHKHHDSNKYHKEHKTHEEHISYTNHEDHQIHQDHNMHHEQHTDKNHNTYDQDQDEHHTHHKQHDDVDILIDEDSFHKHTGPNSDQDHGHQISDNGAQAEHHHSHDQHTLIDILNIEDSNQEHKSDEGHEHHLNQNNHNEDQEHNNNKHHGNLDISKAVVSHDESHQEDQEHHDYQQVYDKHEHHHQSHNDRTTIHDKHPHQQIYHNDLDILNLDDCSFEEIEHGHQLAESNEEKSESNHQDDHSDQSVHTNPTDWDLDEPDMNHKGKHQNHKKHADNSFDVLDILHMDRNSSEESIENGLPEVYETHKPHNAHHDDSNVLSSEELKHNKSYEEDSQGTHLEDDETFETDQSPSGHIAAQEDAAKPSPPDFVHPNRDNNKKQKDSLNVLSSEEGKEDELDLEETREHDTHHNDDTYTPNQSIAAHNDAARLSPPDNVKMDPQEHDSLDILQGEDGINLDTFEDESHESHHDYGHDENYSDQANNWLGLSSSEDSTYENCLDFENPQNESVEASSESHQSEVESGDNSWLESNEIDEVKAQGSYGEDSCDDESEQDGSNQEIEINSIEYPEQAMENEESNQQEFSAEPSSEEDKPSESHQRKSNAQKYNKPVLIHLSHKINSKKEAFYRYNAADAIQTRLDRQLNTNCAKNVVLIVADDKAIASIRQVRLVGSHCMPHNRPGNQCILGDYFFNIALIKAECYNNVQPDQSCTASALFTGIKVNKGTVAVLPDVEYCPHEYEDVEDDSITSIITWAQKVGKRTGFVTTAKVTAPSVSAIYAHSCNSHWEADIDLPPREHNCTENLDMAAQLIYNEEGQNLNVIYGGGRKNFLPVHKRGVRKDGRHLIREWAKLKHGKSKHVYIRSAADLNHISLKTDYVLGLFGQGSLEGDRNAPKLCDMVENAIHLLDREDQGYVLVVQQDKTKTYGNELADAEARKEQLKEIFYTIDRVLSLSNEQNTLIVFTSNFVTKLQSNQGKAHEDTSELSGYVSEENSIIDETAKSCNAIETGEDALLMASGPFSHLFSNVIDQYKVPRIIAYASCMGNGPRGCE